MQSKTRLRALETMATNLRKDVICMLATAPSGHTAGPLGLAEIMTALYFDVATLYPKRPQHPGRDFIVLSNGHCCPILYAAMARRGFFPLQELATLRTFGSRLQGHPHRPALPGLETTSGPLGSGLSQSIGMALGLRSSNKKNHVFCITSDGEHDEGNTWEGILAAAKFGLGNLTVIIDRNDIQIDGHTTTVMPLGSLAAKYQSFGWKTTTIDGNAMEQVVRALHDAKRPRNVPFVIVANTVPGKGVSFMEHDYHWHGRVPRGDEVTRALTELQVVTRKRR